MEMLAKKKKKTRKREIRTKEKKNLMTLNGAGL
jgi:hypothetical protein